MKRWIIVALWFAIGVYDLIKGDITRADYGCVWLLLMIDMVLDRLCNDEESEVEK